MCSNCSWNTHVYNYVCKLLKRKKEKGDLLHFQNHQQHAVVTQTVSSKWHDYCGYLLRDVREANWPPSVLNIIISGGKCFCVD